MPSFRELVMDLISGRGHEPAHLDIDVGQLAGAPDPGLASAAREGMWKQSSFDLLRGLEVSEEPMETMPDELIDAFLKN